VVDFADEKDVARWLEGKPREVAPILAARAALRAAPVLVAASERRGGLPRIEREIVLPVFRAMAVAWTAGHYPRYAVDLGAASAASAAANAPRNGLTHKGTLSPRAPRNPWSMSLT
jgi:hypothetical protein